MLCPHCNTDYKRLASHEPHCKSKEPEYVTRGIENLVALNLPNFRIVTVKFKRQVWIEVDEHHTYKPYLEIYPHTMRNHYFVEHLDHSRPKECFCYMVVKLEKVEEYVKKFIANAVDKSAKMNW